MIFQNLEFVGGRSTVNIQQNYNVLNVQTKSVSLSHSTGTQESGGTFFHMRNVSQKSSSVVAATSLSDGQVTKTPWGVTLKPVPRTKPGLAEKSIDKV